jgi:hypothetical protein
MLRARSTLVLIALAGFALAGCSSPPSPQPVEPSAVEPIETSIPTPAPTPEGLHINGTVSVTHDDGYTAEVAYDVQFGAVTTSIVDDTPGKGSVHVSAETAVYLTNTTPGRNWPLDGGNPVGFGIYALYIPSADDLLCKGLDLRSYNYGGGSTYYCAVRLGGEDLYYSTSGNWILRTPLGSGETSVNLSPGDSGPITLSGIDEALLSVVEQGIGEPEAIAVIATHVWGEGHCLFGPYSQIVASTPAIPGCTA